MFVKKYINLNVEMFIHNNNLTDVLLDAPTYIAKYFDNFILEFELYDKEILLIHIVTPLSTKEAMTQLKLLFKNWKVLSDFEKTKHFNIMTKLY